MSTDVLHCEARGSWVSRRCSMKSCCKRTIETNCSCFALQLPPSKRPCRLLQVLHVSPTDVAFAVQFAPAVMMQRATNPMLRQLPRFSVNVTHAPEEQLHRLTPMGFATSKILRLTCTRDIQLAATAGVLDSSRGASQPYHSVPHTR